MWRRIAISPLIAIAFLGHSCFARPLHPDFELWQNISVFGSLRPVDASLNRVRYYLYERTAWGDTVTRLSQTLFLGGAGYAVTPHWSLIAGYGYHYSTSPFDIPQLYGQRVFQQARWHKTCGTVTVISRTRLAERFLSDVSGMALRARQKFKISAPLNFAPSFLVVASDEFFWDINNNSDDGDRYGINGFSQNRLFAGIGYAFSSRMVAELGYQNVFLRKSSDNLLSHAIYLKLLVYAL